MADNTETGSNNNLLYFIVGGLVVLAGLFAFLHANGYVGTRDVNVTVEAPAEIPAPGTATTTSE